VAWKAINTIKDQIAGMRWRIQPRPGRGEQLPDADLRIRILTDNFDAPNPDDSKLRENPRPTLRLDSPWSCALQTVIFKTKFSSG
jgi:hypothetical protein